MFVCLFHSQIGGHVLANCKLRGRVPLYNEREGDGRSIFHVIKCLKFLQITIIHPAIYEKKKTAVQ